MAALPPAQSAGQVALAASRAAKAAKLAEDSAAASSHSTMVNGRGQGGGGGESGAGSRGRAEANTAEAARRAAWGKTGIVGLRESSAAEVPQEVWALGKAARGCQPACLEWRPWRRRRRVCTGTVGHSQQTLRSTPDLSSGRRRASGGLFRQPHMRPTRLSRRAHQPHAPPPEQQRVGNLHRGVGGVVRPARPRPPGARQQQPDRRTAGVCRRHGKAGGAHPGRKQAHGTTT